MLRQGFIHDKLDIKFLILYIMARVEAPIGFLTLTDLVMIDNGVDYFDFAEAVPELTEAGLLTCRDERYSITDIGRRDGAECESSLPPSVRAKCDEKLAELNAALRRAAQVRAQVLPREDGGCTLRLCLDDDAGNLLTLELCCPTEQQARYLANGFLARPEPTYNALLDLLIIQAEKERSHD